MRKILLPLLIGLVLTSCRETPHTKNLEAGETEESYAVAYSFDKSIAVTPTPVPSYEEYGLYIEKKRYTPAKYEPAKPYAGAYIKMDKTVDGDIGKFEQIMKTEHCLYSYHLKMGEEYPLNWVLECIAEGKTPNFVVMPAADGMFDEEALRKTANDIGLLNVPVFVQFMPVSKDMKYNPEEYVAFFRKAKDAFALEAPKAALVWCVYYQDVYDSGPFYPGDAYVDWVGISIFANPDAKGQYGDIYGPLDFMCYQYQKRKPIMVSELAISHYSTKDSKYYTEEAAREIEKFYQKAVQEYPRVKAVIYVDYDGVPEAGKQVGNDYSITMEESIINAYSKTAGGGGYSAELLEKGESPGEGAVFKSPFPALAGDNGEYLVSYKTLYYDVEYKDMDLLYGKDVLVEGEKYYTMGALNKISQIDFYVDVENKKMVLQVD